MKAKCTSDKKEVHFLYRAVVEVVDTLSFDLSFFGSASLSSPARYAPVAQMARAHDFWLLEA